MGIPAPGNVGSRISLNGYTAAAPFTGMTSADYDLRNTTTRSAFLPLAYGGVVDLSIGLQHQLLYALGTGLALNAANDTVTKAAHGLYNGQIVQLANNTATGVSNAVNYYVANAAANTFQLASATGVVQDITADGTADVNASADVHVELYAMLNGLSGALVAGPQLFGTTVQASDVPYDGRILLLPEVSDAPMVVNAVWGVPELRQPIHTIKLSYGARHTPVSGSLAFQVIGRS